MVIATVTCDSGNSLSITPKSFDNRVDSIMSITCLLLGEGAGATTFRPLLPQNADNNNMMMIIRMPMDSTGIMTYLEM